MGIVVKKEIWATHTQYLNDRREFILAVDMMEKSINALSVSTDESRSAVLAEMKRALAGIENMDVCVCSFSENRDSLSQWRAYGAGSSGFALGFSGSFLAEIAAKSKWSLAPCIYNPDEQRKVVDALVATVLEQNLKLKQSNPSLLEQFPPGGVLTGHLARYAPILKHNSFQDEKEWRLISLELGSRFNGFDFREGGSMLIPFYRFPLKDCEGNFRLHEIVIGPTPFPKESEMSVKSFLARNFQENVAVEVSKVPYRSW